MPRSLAYLELGRGEMRAGRSLYALLGAYRLAAEFAAARLAPLQPADNRRQPI